MSLEELGSWNQTLDGNLKDPGLQHHHSWNLKEKNGDVADFRVC